MEIIKWKRAFGYRQKVLDGLVSTYVSVTELNYHDGSENGEIRESMKKPKRQFTSEVQKIIAPNSLEIKV